MFAVTALVAAGCGSDERQDPTPVPQGPYPSPVSQPTSTPTAGDHNVPIVVADGVLLRPGADGRLPVTVRWTYQGAVPETFAVDRPRGLLYLDDELATALDLADGRVVWEVGSPPRSTLEGGLSSDGGDVIGRSGPASVRFFAPYNFDLVVDPATGTRTSFQYGGGAQARGDLRPFARPRPRDPRVAVGQRRVVARTADGRVSWRVRVEPERANIWAIGPVAVPRGVAFVLSTGLVVVLDWESG
jgi:hypothetical protein